VKRNIGTRCKQLLKQFEEMKKDDEQISGKSSLQTVNGQVSFNSPD